MIWIGRELKDLIPAPCDYQTHLPLDQVHIHINRVSEFIVNSSELVELLED